MYESGTTVYLISFHEENGWPGGEHGFDIGDEFIVQRGPDVDGDYFVLPLKKDTPWPTGLYVQHDQVTTTRPLSGPLTPERIEEFLS